MMVGKLLKSFLAGVGPMSVLVATYFSMPGPVVEVALPEPLSTEDTMLTANIYYAKTSRLPAALLVTSKGIPVDVLHQEVQRVVLDNGKDGLKVTFWLHSGKRLQWI